MEKFQETGELRHKEGFKISPLNVAKVNRSSKVYFKTSRPIWMPHIKNGNTNISWKTRKWGAQLLETHSTSALWRCLAPIWPTLNIFMAFLRS